MQHEYKIFEDKDNLLTPLLNRKDRIKYDFKISFAFAYEQDISK